MEYGKQDEVNFDIIVLAKSQSGSPTIGSLNSFRPKFEHLELCRRWFLKRGVICHPTSFGLTCIAPVELFCRIFETKLERVQSDAGMSYWRQLSEFRLPPDISKYIGQITLSIPPDLF